MDLIKLDYIESILKNRHSISHNMLIRVGRRFRYSNRHAFLWENDFLMCIGRHWGMAFPISIYLKVILCVVKGTYWLKCLRGLAFLIVYVNSSVLIIKKIGSYSKVAFNLSALKTSLRAFNKSYKRFL